MSPPPGTIRTGGPVHRNFSQHTIHTAKCERCPNHNREIIRRCTDCTVQICTPCYENDPNHGAHCPPVRRSHFAMKRTPSSDRRDPKIRRRRKESSADSEIINRMIEDDEGNEDSTSASNGRRHKRRRVETRNKWKTLTDAKDAFECSAEANILAQDTLPSRSRFSKADSRENTPRRTTPRETISRESTPRETIPKPPSRSLTQDVGSISLLLTAAQQIEDLERLSQDRGRPVPESKSEDGLDAQAHSPLFFEDESDLRAESSSARRQQASKALKERQLGALREPGKIEDVEEGVTRCIISGEVDLRWQRLLVASQLRNIYRRTLWNKDGLLALNW